MPENPTPPQTDHIQTPPTVTPDADWTPTTPIGRFFHFCQKSLDNTRSRISNGRHMIAEKVRKTINYGQELEAPKDTPWYKAIPVTVKEAVKGVLYKGILEAKVNVGESIADTASAAANTIYEPPVHPKNTLSDPLDYAKRPLGIGTGLIQWGKRFFIETVPTLAHGVSTGLKNGVTVLGELIEKIPLVGDRSSRLAGWLSTQLHRFTTFVKEKSKIGDGIIDRLNNFAHRRG